MTQVRATRNRTKRFSATKLFKNQFPKYNFPATNKITVSESATDNAWRHSQGLSFEVRPGQKVALVGSAGCGKSSAMRLVERLYAADSGAVLVDGRPIEDYDVHALRRATAVVAQENVLFDKVSHCHVLARHCHVTATSRTGRRACASAI